MTHQASAEDLTFLSQLESCTLKISDFSHQAHLRMAYIYLIEHDIEETTRLVRKTLHQLLSYNGVDLAKYHETLTGAWIRAVNSFMRLSSPSNSFHQFIDNSSELLTAEIMYIHYSKERLFSEEAKERYIKPNLKAFPKP